MEKYNIDEIDITQWQSQDGDKLLFCMTKIDKDMWKGELHKTFGLYYKTLISDEKVRDLLNSGWKLQQKDLS